MSGYDIALTMDGKDEVNNYKELNQYLSDHANNKDIKIDVRKTAWCAAIMNAWERAAGKQGTGKLNARSFSNYGVKVDLKNAKPGDIVVFERGNDGWSGHVAYFVSTDGKSITHFGGNQWSTTRGASDEVNYGKTAISKLLAIRRS